ncbi:hypothetical protein FRB95_009350 [Tulasnella sp. JGI-2019a]|nr:hypothetical protein FRB95_009350 [Tulasnella sp. JGI-2019a]
MIPSTSNPQLWMRKSPQGTEESVVSHQQAYPGTLLSSCDHIKVRSILGFTCCCSKISIKNQRCPESALLLISDALLPTAYQFLKKVMYVISDQSATAIYMQLASATWKVLE